MKWDLFETVCFSRIHLCQGRFREWSVWPHLRCCVTWLIEVSWTPGLRPWDHFTRWPTSSTLHHLHHLSISTVPYWSPQLWQSGLFKLLKKQLVAVGLGIKNLYICSKYVFLWSIMTYSCMSYVCLFQWFSGESHAEGLGANCGPVYSRSVDVSEFSAEVCWDPSGSWSSWGPEGCCGCSGVTAWSSCSAGAGLHGVSLTTGGLQFSSQFFSFAALTFQI